VSAAAADPEGVRRVAVLGAGTIGTSWTALFLAAGLKVSIYDPAEGTEARVREFVAHAWPALERLGLARTAAPAKPSFHAEPAAAVAGADWVQENGPESLEAKRALYAAMEPGLAADAVVASSTSGIMPSELQAGRTGEARYIVAHPFNPPHLIPLVELVGGRATAPAAIDRAEAFYRGLGKVTIRVRREVPGHVVNRMQAALYREAINLVLAGVADLADVDRGIAYGPGLRWAIMGPHATHHLAGGKGGLRHLLGHIGPGLQRWMDDLDGLRITPDVIERLVAAHEASEPPSIEHLEAERDALLLALLETLRATRRQLAAQGEGRLA
jgi:carnitine 3-dehydrogenase